MLFSNAIVMPFTEAFPKDIDALREALEQNRFKPCKGVEDSKMGWIPPSRVDDGEILLEMGSAVLLCLQEETKLLPSSVINEEVNSIVKIREKDGHRVSTKERNKIKEDVRFDLLPQAFSKFSRTLGYIDFQRQELIINVGSEAKAETFQIYLRKATGSLPVSFLKTEISIPQRLTDWLSGEKPMPKKLSFGVDVTLKEEDGGTATFKKQDLAADEVIQCINAGKVVKQLNFSWNDYLSFSIDEKGIIKKISAEDMFNLSYQGEFHESDNGADPNYSSLEADFFLTFETMRTIIPLYRQWFEFKSQDFLYEIEGATNDPLNLGDVTISVVGSAAEITQQGEFVENQEADDVADDEVADIDAEYSADESEFDDDEVYEMDSSDEAPSY